MYIAAQIIAPDIILLFRRAGGGDEGLFDGIPLVVLVGCGLGESPYARGAGVGFFSRAAHAPVVAELDLLRTFRRGHRGDGDKLVFRIPSVIFHAIGEQVAVVIVYRVDAGDSRVLIGAVRRVGSGASLIVIRATVAHRVVGVGLIERRHHGGSGIGFLGGHKLLEAVVTIIPLLTVFFHSGEALIICAKGVDNTGLIAVGGRVGYAEEAGFGIIGAVGAEDIALGGDDSAVDGRSELAVVAVFVARGVIAGGNRGELTARIVRVPDGIGGRDV